MTETVWIPDPERSAFASASLVRHLCRGALGFGLAGCAVALTPIAGPIALALAAPGVLALRGCPMCWIVSLVETISAGRLKRTCTENGCTVRPAAALATERTPLHTAYKMHLSQVIMGVRSRD